MHTSESCGSYKQVKMTLLFSFHCFGACGGRRRAQSRLFPLQRLFHREAFSLCINSVPLNPSLGATVWHRSLVQVPFVLQMDFGARGRTCAMCRGGRLPLLSEHLQTSLAETITIPSAASCSMLLSHRMSSSFHSPLSPQHTHTLQRMKTR